MPTQRICTLTSVNTRTVTTYRPWDFGTFVIASDVNAYQPASSPRAASVSHENASQGFWSAGPWDTEASIDRWVGNGTNNAVPATVSVLATRGAIIWDSEVSVTGGGNVATPTAASLRSQQNPFIGVLSGGSEVARLPIMAGDDTTPSPRVFELYELLPVLSLIGYLAVIDTANVTVSPTGGSVSLASGNITLGFSSSLLQSPSSVNVDEKVWCEIIEQGSRTGLISVDLNEVPLPTIEQVAIFRMRYSDERAIGVYIVDDLGRTWNVTSNEASPDRRYLELEATRVIN